MTQLFDDLMPMRKHMEQLFDSFMEFLRNSKKTVFLVLVVAAITIVLSTTISILLSRINHLYVPSLGTIRTIGVEAYGGDITLDEKGEKQIDWGMIYPGILTNRSFYVQSKSNIETILNCTTGNWTFRDSYYNDVTGSISSYNIKRSDAMNTICDQNGTLISPGEEIYVTVTLWASDDISFINYLMDEKVKGFSFDICIYASEE